jgi:phosphatidylglycerol:prolipoprotein diacylglycerol transferase
MYPDLLQVGNLTIHSFGVMLVLAVIISVFLLYREAPGANINQDLLLEAVVFTIFFGLLGARLLYIAFNWIFFSEGFPVSLFSRFEGLSFFGGLIAGILTLYLWSRKRKISFLKLGDLLAPYLMLGYAIGRIGCFLNGCCYGIETSVPWALPARIGETALRHPVQIYAALGALLIFFALKKARLKRPFIGFILFAMIALYSLLRFLTDFFRFGQPAWLGLSAAQLVSLCLILVTAGLLFAYYYLLPEDYRPVFKLPRITKKKKLRSGRKFR